LQNPLCPPLIGGYMASTFAITRNHLIFGVCLPVALLLGYLLADAQDPMSVFFVGLAGVVLSIPLLIKWYYPVLIMCWNMNAAPAIPGQPALWAVMAFIALIVVVVNRAMIQGGRLAPVPALTRPFLAFLTVVVVTAMLTGGIGLGALRSGAMGGKHYFYIGAAIAGFFVLGSKAIPRARAGWYVALFFLPGLLAILPRVAAWLGPAANFVYVLFPPDEDPAVMASINSFGGQRLRGVALASTMVYFWLLARVGVAGLLDFSKPWRLATFGAMLFTAALGGFRSIAIYMILTFAVLFFLEKLWRTRAVIILGVIVILGGILLMGFSDKLPYSVQRTLSFLPLDLDSEVISNAEDSSEWRLQMWREVWEKEVPKYFILGKGYQINPDDLYLAGFALQAGHWRNWEWAFISGDYHNGPFSLLIPFGIFGVIGFLWLVIAGGRFLYRNYRNSPPELQQINGLLLAYFIARSLFFFTIYGAISSDLFIFTGILGLSVALNVPDQTQPASLPPAELEPAPQV
jgi:hypothetical protein